MIKQSRFFKVLLPTLLLFASWVNASRLFLLDESTPGKCIAKTIDLPEGRDTELFSAKTCPTSIVWLDESKSIYFSDGKSIWLKTQGQIASQELAKLPQAETALWVDAGTHKPRIAVLREPDAKDKFNSSGLPSWGVPYIATAFELRDGKWITLEEKATKSDADETPDIFALDTYANRNSSGNTLAQLLKNTTCAGQNLDCSSEEPRFSKALGQQEGYGKIGFKNGAELTFSVIYGDTPHASFPVKLCRNSCKSITNILDDEAKMELGDQLALASHGRFILIAKEYENSSPRIIDTDSGKTVLYLPRARSAVWLPYFAEK